MIIFLRKIPATTKLSEIEDFVSPALKGFLFGTIGRIEKIEILVLQDKLLNTIEFHGLVTIDPERAAKRVIKKLKGRRFKGKQIIIRQYYQRNWHNDPRMHAEQRGTHSERRKADRRRGGNLETIKDISEQFSSHKSFVRKAI